MSRTQTWSRSPGVALDVCNHLEASVGFRLTTKRTTLAPKTLQILLLLFACLSLALEGSALQKDFRSFRVRHFISHLWWSLENSISTLIYLSSEASQPYAHAAEHFQNGLQAKHLEKTAARIGGLIRKLNAGPLTRLHSQKAEKLLRAF